MPAVAAPGPRVRNTVHDAAIWRQTISYELSTAKEWEKNWGFMRGLYDHNGTETLKLPPLAATTPRAFISGLPSKLPQGLTSDPTSLTADLLSMHDIPRITRSLYPKQKYTFPATTQQEVGWDWNRDGLERTAGEVETVLGADSVERGNPDRRIRASEREAVRDGEKSVVDAMQRRFAGDANPNPVRYRTLERFGREARGQGDVLKWWGGCRESLN
ncbi:hypothetical protein HKX48_007755 [Thoreauomyces humboldtii]|nr:hypothetical protein HKX48_007755 [Thoreauomyces humboldtii]